MPDYTITFRPYTAEDISFIQTVYASSRQVEMDMVPWSAEEKSRFLNMQCQAQLQHYQTHYLNAAHDIILCNDKPIGRLYVNRNVQEIRLMDITLLPAYRQLGIGSQIIRAVMFEGDKANLPVTLNVEIINPKEPTTFITPHSAHQTFSSFLSAPTLRGCVMRQFLHNANQHPHS